MSDKEKQRKEEAEWGLGMERLYMRKMAEAGRIKGIKKGED